MDKFKVYMEKGDKWMELGVFSANSGEEAMEQALNSTAILEFYSIEELKFVNLEYEKLTT